MEGKEIIVAQDNDYIIVKIHVLDWLPISNLLLTILKNEEPLRAEYEGMENVFKCPHCKMKAVELFMKTYDVMEELLKKFKN